MGGKGSGRRPSRKPKTAQDAVKSQKLVRPESLNGDAAAFWDRVVELCGGYLVAADGPWLEMTSRAWSVMQNDIRQVRLYPDEPGYRRRWMESMKVWMEAAKALGLNPKERKHISQPDPVTEDPFEKFLGVVG